MKEYSIKVDSSVIILGIEANSSEEAIAKVQSMIDEDEVVIQYTDYVISDMEA